MLTIRILAVGKCKDDYIRSGCGDYAKRLSRFCKLEIVEVKDFPDGADAMEREAELLLPKLKGMSVPLCVEGEQMSSEELAAFLERCGLTGESTVTFVIGGSGGLSDRVKRTAAKKLSFSRMTFPHGLIRLILLEQIYRGFKINAGESYHK